MRDVVAWAIWVDAVLLLSIIATYATAERRRGRPTMTLRLVREEPTQRARIQASEWHALDRKLAVARLKDELEPRARRRRLKRWVGERWRALLYWILG